MYPILFEIPIPFLGSVPVYSFGAMVAVGVLLAAWLARRELDRMYRQGLVGSVPMEVDENGRRRTRQVSPAMLMPTFATLAVVGGIVGSKLFHILENLDEFALDPMGMIFSRGGLTFYGGLIVAGSLIAWTARKKGLSVARLADATAPGLMLAYGVGRIGCYLAGDGDWGVCSDLANKPGWLPAWLWSETFPHSLVTDSVFRYNAAQGDFCAAGADGVFPTMLYEFAMCALVLFPVLWLLRRHKHAGGWLFALYLVFNGAERFVIEQVRINNEFFFLGFTPTQAEVIAATLVLIGLVGMALTWKRGEGVEEAEEPAEATA